MNKTLCRTLPKLAPIALAAMFVMANSAMASSHGEAPFIATQRKVDASDFYMFNSYETGRADFVTIIANYQPLQDAYGGPNFFKMDQNALYEIHIDNVGDAKEHLTFQFRFKNTLANAGAGTALTVGTSTVAIPLVQSGAVSTVASANLNVLETYTVTLVRGDRRTGTATPLSLASNAATTTFNKPVDNIGKKTIADYPAYANQHIYAVTIPGCATPGKVFVGQRKDPFAVNLGVIFDLVNAPVAVITDPSLIGAAGAGDLATKNVTTLALEVPKTCLLDATNGNAVIGGWTTASLRQSRLLDPAPKPGYQTTDKTGGAWTQVSRLGMPLVNEVVIGLKDKDRFNSSKPSGDGQFLTYVSNPTLPKLLETVLSLPNTAPTNYPRNDLVTTFLTGIAGVNQLKTVTPSEMLRLNTSIAAVPFAQQNRLGIVGNILAGGTDNAGYPNGRRPKDDIVDISLVAMMGGLCMANGTTNALGFGTACNSSAAVVPLQQTSFKLHDAVDQATVPLLTVFPYLNTPLGGTN